jgi:hypothetical protein
MRNISFSCNAHKSFLIFIYNLYCGYSTTNAELLHKINSWSNLSGFNHLQIQTEKRGGGGKKNSRIVGEKGKSWEKFVYVLGGGGGSQASPAHPSDKDGKLEESLNCVGCITNTRLFILII